MPRNERLDRAFAELRRMGMIAKQEHLCCQRCGGSDIYNRIGERMKEGQPPPLGVCFYHEQDADDRDAYEDFFLAFGSGHPDDDEQPVPSEEVGRRIVATLYENGIETEWDGSIHERIKILASSLWHDDVGYLAQRARRAQGDEPN